MGFFESIMNITKKSREARKNFLDESVEISVPDNIYWMRLAIYTATTIIANAFVRAKIIVYKDNKRVKDGDYYSLNVKANPNESASQFWHKVVTKSLTEEKGALVFESKGNLYCADDFNIREQRPFRGNLYDGIVVDGLQLNKVFMAKDVMIFKLDNRAASTVIKGVNEEYGKIISQAIQAYGDANIKKYKLKIDGIQAGDEEFAEEFENFLKQPLQQYINNEKKLYIEYDGRKLEQMKSEGNNTKDVTDFIQTVESYFKLVGKAYKIPESLMMGNITNVKDIVNQTLTFAVDPYAEMVADVLTGAYGFESFSRGNYFKVDTTSVNHIDLINMGSDISQIVGSSVTSVNEIREITNLDQIDEPWANEHVRTKNFESVKIKNEKEEGNDGKTDGASDE